MLASLMVGEPHPLQQWLETAPSLLSARFKGEGEGSCLAGILEAGESLFSGVACEVVASDRLGACLSGKQWSHHFRGGVCGSCFRQVLCMPPLEVARLLFPGEISAVSSGTASPTWWHHCYMTSLCQGQAGPSKNALQITPPGRGDEAVLMERVYSISVEAYEYNTFVLLSPQGGIWSRFNLVNLICIAEYLLSAISYLIEKLSYIFSPWT